MYDPLKALDVVFSDIYPWGLIWDARDKLRARADMAVYTYEYRLMQEIDANPALLQDGAALKAAATKVRDSVVEDFQYDAKVASLHFYLIVMRTIVMPPFAKLVIPACKAILDPLASTIPSAFKDIIDPRKTFDGILKGIIDGAIREVIQE
jgi:hypothetical protein